jgi:hypothetical protein
MCGWAGEQCASDKEAATYSRAQQVGPPEESGGPLALAVHVLCVALSISRTKRATGCSLGHMQH